MVHSTDQFTYSRAAKCYAAEISDLDPNPWEPVYPNKPLQGITVVSSETGLEATFAFSHIVRDRENDILAWVCIATPETIKRLPQLEGHKVELLND